VKVWEIDHGEAGGRVHVMFAVLSEETLKQGWVKIWAPENTVVLISSYPTRKETSYGDRRF
jgi:hypothetical protein